MFTTSFRDAILNTMRATTLTSWTPYLGLFTAVTDLRAGTVTEGTVYTGYGTRPSVTFGAPATTSPAGGRQVANSALVTLPANTGSNVDVIGWGLWDAATVGVLKIFGFLDADAPVIGTAAADDLVTSYGHGLSTNQRVFVMAAPGAVIPTGLAENTAYYVIATGLTADVFSISTTQGGAAVNITAGGAAQFIPYTAVTIAGGSTPEFAISALVEQL